MPDTGTLMDTSVSCPVGYRLSLNRYFGHVASRRKGARMTLILADAAVSVPEDGSA